MENVDIKMPVPDDKKLHTYEIIMPYGDSVDIAGISVDQTAEFVKPETRPKLRCATYGDSITQGFTAGSIAGTYAFRLAKKKNWQLVNLGIGGRSSNPNDGTFLGKIKCDFLIVLMGVNDWQGGRPITAYQKNMRTFIINFRKLQKNTPVYFITPLWVPSSWQPKNAKFKLENYRQALHDIVKESNDVNLKLIEGPELIDHDKKYFDCVAVHPNDAGFKMMAERLTYKLKR
ncbi:MAG: SGNH/GDSL hydrolase family protein [Victivallaceae bacterium]|nr:SGNH/GDSL hydrolase family protein [Victivallaceae bacterium]